MILESQTKLPTNLLTRSHFQTGAGDKFNRMLWHLSTLALQSVYEEQLVDGEPKLKIPNINPSNLESIKILNKSLKVHLSLRINDLLKHAEQVASEQKQWRTLALQLETDIWEISNHITELYKKQTKIDDYYKSKNQHTISESQRETQRNLKIQQIRTIWNTLTRSNYFSPERTEIMDDIINNASSPVVINGVDFDIKICDVLNSSNSSSTVLRKRSQRQQF